MPTHVGAVFLHLYCAYIVLLNTSTKMPPKSKRKLQPEAARARKVAKLDESSESEEAGSNCGVERSYEPSVSDRGDERSECEERRPYK